MSCYEGLRKKFARERVWRDELDFRIAEFLEWLDSAIRQGKISEYHRDGLTKTLKSLIEWSSAQNE